MEKGPNYYEDSQQPNLRPEYIESMRRRDILDEITPLKEELTKEDPRGHYDKRLALIQKIKEAYPDDYDTYQLWNFLVGGTIEKDRQPNFDFPGELSVENFIRQLAEGHDAIKDRPDQREAA
jgi:hypothetical protein